MGTADFIKKKSGILNWLEDLILHLLLNSDAQICVSLIIPTSNNSVLNDRIALVNKEIIDYVSWLHSRDADARKRVFTYSNSSMSGQNNHSIITGPQLTARGEKMLWIRLREGLRKALRLPRVNYHPTSTRRSTNNSNHG